MIPEPTLTHMRDEYSWVEKKGEEAACIRLNKPPFAGLVYHYGRVFIPGETHDDGKRDVNFEFDVVFTPPGFDELLIETQAFTDILGDILLSILEEVSIKKLRVEAGIKDLDKEPEVITIELDCGENDGRTGPEGLSN